MTEGKPSNGQEKETPGAGQPPGTPARQMQDPNAKPTVAQMLGEITWLLSQSPMHKHFTLGDLEWMVMPAILLEQFRVFRGEKNPTPAGVALWAWLTEDAEERLIQQAAAGAGARLRPDEWKGGDRLWVIEIIAPQATTENKMTEVMLADLAQNAFPGQKFKFHVANPLTGAKEIREIGG